MCMPSTAPDSRGALAQPGYGLGRGMRELLSYLQADTNTSGQVQPQPDIHAPSRE